MVAHALHAVALSNSPWANANWLVIAPHADDEILGCAALIDEAAKDRRIAAIAFLTDGTGSHPCETHSDRQGLASLRRHEARTAVRMISPSAPAPIFLAWPDAHPHAGGSKDFNKTAIRLSRLCDRLRVDAIAVTGRDEPHCDHVAAFEIAHDVGRRAIRPTRIFEYLVWAPHAPCRDYIAVKTDSIVIGKRKTALAQHRSQLTPIAGDGFRVPPAMRNMPACDILYTKRS